MKWLRVGIVVVVVILCIYVSAYMTLRESGDISFHRMSTAYRGFGGARWETNTYVASNTAGIIPVFCPLALLEHQRIPWETLPYSEGGAGSRHEARVTATRLHAMVFLIFFVPFCVLIAWLNWWRNARDKDAAG